MILTAASSQLMETKVATVPEKKGNHLHVKKWFRIQLSSRAFLRNCLTRFSLVVPQRLGGPENFVAGVARIFETLNVLLNVLFHMAFVFRFEVTVGASIAAINVLVNHCFDCCHCVRVN